MGRFTREDVHVHIHVPVPVPDTRLDTIIRMLSDARIQGERMTQSSAAAVEQLMTSLNNIQGDVNGIKAAMATQAADQEAVIAQLREDLAAALAAGDPAAIQAAVDAAVAAADAGFTALLQPANDLAANIDMQTDPIVEPPVEG